MILNLGLTLFAKHFAERGPFETVAREFLLGESLEQLGGNVQDLFACCPEIGREAEEELEFCVEYTPDTPPGSSDHANLV